MLEEIMELIGENVLMSYETIALGNCSAEEQDSETLYGSFTGDMDSYGRCLRLRFEPENGREPLFLFIDEILSVELAGEPVTTSSIVM